MGVDGLQPDEAEHSTAWEPKTARRNTVKLPAHEEEEDFLSRQLVGALGTAPHSGSPRWQPAQSGGSCGRDGNAGCLAPPNLEKLRAGNSDQVGNTLPRGSNLLLVHDPSQGQLPWLPMRKLRQGPPC